MHPRLADLVVVADQQNAVHDGNSEHRNKSYRRGNAEVETRHVQAQQTAGDRERDARQGEQAVVQRIEQSVEKHHDQDEADRNDDCKTRLRLLERAELAGPLDPIPRRQLYLPGDLVLGVGDGASQVAAADTEFDRNEPLIVFTIDIGGAGIQRYRRKLPEGNVSVRAAVSLKTDLDVSDRIEAVAVFRRQADDQRETALAFENRRCL